MTVYYHTLKLIVDEHDLGSIKGVLGYESRAFALGERKDTVILSSDLERETSAIRGHYNRIGLEYCGEVVFADSHKVLEQFAGEEISVFLHTPKLLKYTGEKRRLTAVAFFGDKNNFIPWAKKHGAKVPKTITFVNKNDFYKHKGDYVLGFPVFFKKAVSDSGVGLRLCRDMKELEEMLTAFGDKAFQLQAPLSEKAIFCNVQFYGTDSGKAVALDATRQILEKHSHAGNETLAPGEFSGIWKSVTPLAEKMVQANLRGVFGIDVAVTSYNGEEKYFVIECNPRWNGSSYPTRIAEKLGVSAWRAEYIYTGPCKSLEEFLSALRNTHLEYNPQKKRGVVVFNWGPIKDGKVGVMFISTDPKERMRLKANTQRVVAGL